MTEEVEPLVPVYVCLLPANEDKFCNNHCVIDVITAPRQHQYYFEALKEAPTVTRCCNYNYFFGAYKSLFEDNHPASLTSITLLNSCPTHSYRQWLNVVHESALNDAASYSKWNWARPRPFSLKCLLAVEHKRHHNLGALQLNAILVF